jgi:hypothetical protein
MITRFPKDLPRYVAAVVGLSFLAWGSASLWSEAAIGRPSSTSGLAYIFIPIWAAVLSAAGFIVGLALRALAARLPIGSHPSRITRGLALAILLAVPALAAIHGRQGVRHIEAAAQPRVLISSALVIRDTVPSRYPVGSRPAVLIWDQVSGVPRDSVTHDLPTVCFDCSSATFVFRGQRSEPLQLPALDYVTSAYLLPLRSDGSVRGYVVVINGRATGRRSVVAVLSPDLHVLHSELLARWWPLEHNPLWAESSEREPSFEVAGVGRAGDGTILLRFNEPADGRTRARGPTRLESGPPRR